MERREVLAATMDRDSRYFRIARCIRPGEWTTYGDVALAANRDARAAMSVGQAAATLPDFPNPHRLLKADGTIAPKWCDAAGRGPEECQRLLEAEGVTFADGKADPGCRVTATTLTIRLTDQ